jgi:hypothetical protein
MRGWLVARPRRPMRCWVHTSGAAACGSRGSSARAALVPAGCKALMRGAPHRVLGSAPLLQLPPLLCAGRSGCHILTASLVQQHARNSTVMLSIVDWNM